MSTILIVDDEKGIRAGLSTALARVGYQTTAAASLAEARAHLASASANARTFDCALLDIRLRDGSGLDLLRELRTGPHHDVPVIVATAYDDSERTIEAMRDGAFDYITKPFDFPRLVEMVERAVKRRRPPEVAVFVPVETSPLVGRSPAMHAVWKLIGRAASSRAPVLVQGEAGVGKRLVARAIHDYSSRGAANVATLRVDASADADKLRATLDGAAPSGSTLLVEGIAELTQAAQGALAAWLADGPAARVVAQVRAANGATEVPLSSELYYQLAVLSITVPPLRERRSDVPLLVSRALSFTPARAITPEAMAALVRHDWPGNVRELFMVVRRAAEMCSGEIIDEHDLPAELATVAAGPAPAGSYAGLPLREALARLERDLLSAALHKADGNRTLAARLLGIPRPQLYAKLEEHGMSERKGPVK